MDTNDKTTNCNGGRHELRRMEPRVMRRILYSALFIALAADVFGAITLFDFETEAEQAAVPGSFADYRTICVTNAFATSGQYAFYFKSGPWRDGLDEWPSFNLNTSVRDWRSYDRLVIDLVSVGEGNDSLSTFICAPTGRVQNGLNAHTTLPARGCSQWVIPLRDWPETCDPANIGRVHLFLDHPRDVRVFIDRITLLAEGEGVPVPDSPLVARDLIPFLSQAASETAAAKRELATVKGDLAAAKDDAAALRARFRSYYSFREACLKARQDASKMSVGLASSMVKVQPRGPDIPAAPATEATVRLARNERESVQVVVVPGDRALKGVRVHVADLRRADGAVFASTNVACDVVGYVHTVRKPPYAVGGWKSPNAASGSRATEKAATGWWPDPILDFLDGVDVADMDAQSFWIRVHCPEDQPAGLYASTLTVSADGVPSHAMPFHVRVNDFAVPRNSPLPMAITFSPGPSAQFATPEEKDLNARLRKDPEFPGNLWHKHELEWGDFLADYYITMDNLYHSGKIHWDVLLRLKEQGRLGRFNLGYWGYFTGGADAEAKWRSTKVAQLKEAYAKAKELGLLDHAYVYGCDEIATNWFGNIRRCVEILKEELPGVPISTTAYDHEFGVGTPLDVMDWFTPLTPKFDPDKAAKSRAAGHQVWWYICCVPHAPQANMFIECPAIEGRILMGAATARQRPDGFLYYQISLWNSPRCITSGPFTDWIPRSWTKYHGDGSWTCVGPDGRPLPTVRLENFRDGLEDYAYAKLLEQKLKELEGTGKREQGAGERINDQTNKRTNESWVRRAQAALAVPADVMKSMTQFTGNPAAVLRWRDEMADLIEAAQAALPR